MPLPFHRKRIHPPVVQPSTFPNATGVYHGMLIARDVVGPPGLLSGGSISSDMDITQLEGATNGIGKNMALLSYTAGLGTDQATFSTFINQIVGHHSAIPVVSLTRAAYQFAQISGGGADTDINKLVAACLAVAPHPVMIRFAWEFNAQFQSNYPVYTSGGLQDLANSFIRIKTLLHNGGATNAFLLWTPNQFYDGTAADGDTSQGNYDIAAGFNVPSGGYSWNPFYSAGGAINHLSFPDDPFYSPPAWGGTWIDAFGLDCYNQSGNWWMTFYQAARNAYTRMQAVAPTYPIYVCETGCGDPTTGKDGHSGGSGYDVSKGHGLIKPGTSSTAETKTQWIIDCFATTLPQAFPMIKGWMWYNLDPGAAHSYYKVEEFQATGSGEDVLATYATQIGNSYYLSALQ